MAASLLPTKKKEDFKEEFLTCSICSETYDNDKHKAKCLPCLHTYCKLCLERIAGKRSQVECPNCRKLVRLPGRTVDSLPHNFLVENLKEYQDIFNLSITCGSCGDHQASSFCHECGLFLCQRCVDAHQQFGPHRHHRLSTMLELQQQQCNPMAKRHRHCTKHPQQDLTMYCKETNCKIPVCATCGLVHHRGHDLIELSLAIAQIIDDMRRSVVEVHEQKQKLASARSKEEEHQKRLNTNFKKQEKEIDAATEKLHQEIDASCKKAHAHLKKLYESDMANRSASLDSINTLSAKMTSAIDFANQSCDRNHPTQLLTSQRQIMDRLNELKKAKLPNVTAVKTEFDFTEKHQSAMIQIQKSLHDFCGVEWLAPDPKMCTIQFGINIVNDSSYKAIVTTADQKGRKLTTGGAKVQTTKTYIHRRLSGEASKGESETLNVTDNNDGHKMHLRAFYQNLFIGDAGKGVDIDQVGGAFIYHQKVQGIPKFLPGDVAPILLPELPPETAKKLEKSEKATRMTATVLADMTGGLLVQYHDGALWVKRHCVSRVFYWTQQLNSTQSVKLDRDKPTKVFDFRAYFDRLQQLATTGYYDFSQEKRPVVVFTFGQQWNGSSSNLKDMYVRIEITPLKAKEELNRVSRGAWDHQSIAVSISEEDIERSENGSVIMAPNLMLQGQYQHEPMSQ